MIAPASDMLNAQLERAATGYEFGRDRIGIRDGGAGHSRISAYETVGPPNTWSNYAHNMLWVYDVSKRNGAVRPRLALHRVADYSGGRSAPSTGSSTRPFTGDGTVKPTRENALNELVLQLRLKERAIVSDILH